MADERSWVSASIAIALVTVLAACGTTRPTTDETSTPVPTMSVEETGRRADDLVDRVVALVDALVAEGFTVFEDDTTPSGSRRIVTGPGEGADESYSVTLRGGPDSSVNRLIDVQVNGPVVETAPAD